MKKLMIGTTTGIVLALTSAFVFAKPHGHERDEGQMPMKMLFKKLDLSDAQREQVKLIMQNAREERGVYGGEDDQIKAQMKQQMQMQSWDEQAVRTLLASQMESAKPAQLAAAKARHQVFNTLTSEQQAKLASLAEKRKDKAKDKQGKRPQGMLRAAKKLGLSDEQQAQISALQDQAHSQREANKSIMQAHREATKALVNASEFDSQAWAQLQDSFAATRIDMGVQRAKNRFDVMAVLSPEQREKWKEKMDKQRDKKRK